MSTISNNEEFVPVWCERCDKQAGYFAKDLKSIGYAVHPRCGYAVINVVCPSCDIGFALPHEQKEPISEWACPECNTVYPLSAAIFERPIPLYLYEELSSAQKQQAHSTSSAPSLAVMVTLGVIALLVIGYLLLWYGGFVGGLFGLVVV